MDRPPAVSGTPLQPRAVGLGLRRALLPALRSAPVGSFDFLEAAPENWIGIGGAPGEAFSELAARHPFVFHGLSLSLGGPAPLDEAFLHTLRHFLDGHRAALYSEHLSACGDSMGHLHDLLPLPCSEEGVAHVSGRIRHAQDILGRRIAVENISYYATVPPAAGARPLTELEFVNAVLAEADCDLLLDVNNIVVNATNHGYDAAAFLRGLPGERIAYVHVAGHRDEEPGLKIDTHGAAVADPVWALLAQAYALFGPRPTLLERDFDFPPFQELLGELEVVRGHLSRTPDHRRAA
jgi:uncharacterized protein (UPF0276 family)